MNSWIRRHPHAQNFLTNFLDLAALASSNKRLEQFFENPASLHPPATVMERKPLNPAFVEVLVSVRQSVSAYWKKQGMHQQAEDLASEGILQCLVKAHLWKRKSSLRTFLTRVAINKGKDVLKSDRRRQLREEKFLRLDAAV